MEETKQPYIAYKGFDENLKCRTEQFKIGETYNKPTVPPLKTCSADGWHYCDEIKDVFGHYPNNRFNRFCEIEVLGDYSKETNKGVTNKFRIIRELTYGELNKSIFEEKLNLKSVKEILTACPQFNIGGSVGLFLHGVRLDRWLDRSGDIDLCSPYYINPKTISNEVDIEEAKPSGNDFDETFFYGGIKCDYKIDPKQKYELIEYDGFTYKVTPLEIIIEAKARYAMQRSGEKHRQDLREMFVDKTTNDKINIR